MTAVEERPGTRPRPDVAPGRLFVGGRWAETQALVPTLAELVAAGRFPVEKLVTHYEFGQIQRAVDDMLAGTTIKPVLRW
ncbi:hypothetical protein [Amycolatopsis sp. NPDC003861]